MCLPASLLYRLETWTETQPVQRVGGRTLNSLRRQSCHWAAKLNPGKKGRQSFGCRCLLAAVLNFPFRTLIPAASETRSPPRPRPVTSPIVRSVARAPGSVAGGGPADCSQLRPACARTGT